MLVSERTCTQCGETKPLDDFPLRRSTKRDGRYPWCRACVSVRSRANVARIRHEVLTHYSEGTPRCACCGETALEFLAIDHINGGGRQHREEGKNGSAVARWLRSQGYPPGFRVLCHNCNSSLGFYGYCPHGQEVEVDAG